MPTGGARFGWGRAKPPAGAGVDPTHWLANGLRMAWLCNTGSVPADAAWSRDLTTVEGAPARGVGPFGGECLSLDGSADNVVLPVERMGAMNSPRSWVVWWFVTAEPGGTSNLLSLTLEGGSGDYFQLVVGRAAGEMRLENGFAGNVVGVPFPAAGVWHQTVVTWDGTTAAIYVDGALAGTGGTAASFTANAPTQAYIGKGGNSFPERFPGLVDHLLWYDRPLTADEVAALYREPFAAVQQPRWFLASASGSSTRDLAGAWPAASGALARLLAALRALAGDWPAATGALARALAALRGLTGSWPAQSGALARTLQALRAPAGSQPAATGALTSWKWAPFAPDADLDAGGWTTQAGATIGLFGVVDEATADDADYVRSAASPAADTLVLSLPAVADAGRSDAGSLRVRFRYGKPAGVAARVDLAVTLRAGATDVATATLPDVPEAFVDGELVLSAAEVAAFRAGGGFADARLAFVADEV